MTTTERLAALEKLWDDWTQSDTDLYKWRALARDLHDEVERLRGLIANDAAACTIPTMGHYRAWPLRQFDAQPKEKPSE